jgi:quercetin dioxygenase-like cupin family protein
MTLGVSLSTRWDRQDEEILIGQIALKFLIDGPASGASVTIFEMSVPAGAKVPAAHSHEGFDETIYGLEGVLTMTVSGQSNPVVPGETLFIRRGTVHRFDNPFPADARILAIITPGVLGSSYFREIAALVQAGAPADPAALAAVMLRYGLTPAT